MDPQKKIEILRLGPAHAAQVAELEALCFDQPWSGEQCRAAFEQPAYAAFGIAREGQLLAYISIFHVGDEMEVLNVAVRPLFRRRGFARRLLILALQACRKMGIQKASLEVRESNIPAIGLYSGLGFIQAGRRPRYYANNEDALVYIFNFEPVTAGI